MALVAFQVTSCQSPGAGVIALEGATLIDGSGARPVRDALVLIENGRVSAIARVNEIRVPRGARHVILIGKTIIPGLIDAHAHVQRWAAPRYLAWGVTTVRDVQSSSDSAFPLRDDLNLGAILGPRMFSAGAAIDGGALSQADATGVTSATAARRAVDQRAVVAADYVTIATRFPQAFLAPLLDEATTLRLSVAADLGTIDALSAARAGVVSIENLSGIVAAAVANPTPYFRAHESLFAGRRMEAEGWARLDSAAIARTARALARTHVVLVPVLALHETYARLGDAALSSRPGMADIPASAAGLHDARGLLGRSTWGAADLAGFRRARPHEDLFVREFVRAGGIVAAGSGAASPLLPPGAALHEELRLLVAAGLTPLQAIGAATHQAARLLHADSLGTLAAGKVADLVVLNRDPSADIDATRDIDWVMTRGRIVAPDSLRRSWGH